MHAVNLEPLPNISIVAPANSMSDISSELIRVGSKRLSAIFDFNVEFGFSVYHQFLAASSSPQRRVMDLHNALCDPKTAFIMAAYGGYNTNDILPYFDYDLYAEHPLPIVGYSDTTVLLNAIFAKTGLSNILGPSFIKFCLPQYTDVIIDSLKYLLCHRRVCINDFPSECKALELSADDSFSLLPWISFQQGKVTGKLVGGNLESFTALLGTPYFPCCKNRLLLVEANDDEPLGRFVRDMVHLRHAGVLDQVSGVIVGQFSKQNTLSSDLMINVLSYIFAGKNYPVVYNVNVSHVDPLLSLPVGGYVTVNARDIPTIVLE